MKKHSQIILASALTFNMLHAGTIASNVSSNNSGTQASTSVNVDFSSLGSYLGIGSGGSITGHVENIIASVGNINTNLDGLFSASNLTSLNGQLSQLSSLGSCFGVDYSLGLDGICGNLGNLGIGGLGDSEALGFLRCVGAGVDSLGNLGVDLSSLCSGAVADQVNTTLSNGTYNGWNGSGTWNGNPANIPTSTGYSSTGVVLANTPEMTAIGDGTAKDKGKSIKETTFPSGKSGNELYANNGGYFADRAKKEPNSSDARSWLEVDNTSLILKEMALKNVGTSKEGMVPLPKNLAEAIDDENNQAKLEVMTFLSLNDAKSALSRMALTMYKEIEAETVASYMAQENKIYSDMIQESDQLKMAYKMINMSIDMKYARKMFFERTKAGHIYDPTQERLQYISPELKNEYVLSSMVQMNKNTELKVKMMKEKKLKKELMDITVERAFYTSSTFPSGAAEAEIEALLMAVDRAID